MRGRRRRRERGFTLLEVMVALLIGMVGLLGTVALQQAMLRASSNSNDQALALRLATQRLEELNVPQLATGLDEMAPLAVLTGTNWSTAEHLTGSGSRVDAGPAVNRFVRQWKVQRIPADAGTRYLISVRVTYGMDSGKDRVVRLDQERRGP